MRLGLAERTLLRMCRKGYALRRRVSGAWEVHSDRHHGTDAGLFPVKQGVVEGMLARGLLEEPMLRENRLRPTLLARTTLAGIDGGSW